MDKFMKERLKEIMKIAKELGWTYPSLKTDYHLMQLSEVEKCMTAMVDIDYLKQMRKWYEDVRKKEVEK